LSEPGQTAPPKTSAEAQVTIVIPSYRHAHYLKECLESLVGQTFAAWKAIVVDDHSPDEEQIRKVVEGFGDARIRIVRHEKNSGLGASRNTGIREADTEFVLPLDSDDKLALDCLESMVPVLAADPTLDCVFPNVQKFGRSNELTVFHGPEGGANLVRVEDTLPGAGTMMRRVFWERVGRYDEAEVMRHGREDFEFYIRAFQKNVNAAKVDKPLYLYRISHTSMATACALHDDEVFDYIYNKHRDLFDATGETKSFLSVGYDSAAFASHHKGERMRAIAMAVRAWRTQPKPTRAKAVARAFFSPSFYRTLRTGIVRSYVPFLGYPLSGRRRYRPFFIIGVARSGNTLFRRILTSHSQLHIPPETFVIGACIRKFKRYSRRMSWDDLVSLMMAEFEFHPEFHTFEIWLGPLVNRLRNAAQTDRNLAFLIDGFFRYHAEVHGPDTFVRWGDKTPMNSLDDALVRGDTPRRLGEGVPQTLERILDVFPDAQFLHIYRDACDVIYSHLSGGFMNSLEEATKRWLHVVRQARNFVRRHAERCHEVQYENLVAAPGDVVPGVCQFLGVDYEPQMVSSERSATALGDVPEWYWHKQVSAPINAKNPGKGRANFTASELAFIQGVAGEEMASLGYPPPTEKHGHE